MADGDLVLADEFHLTVLLPRDTADDVVREVRRVLGEKAFRARLRRLVRRACGGTPLSAPVVVRIGR